MWERFIKALMFPFVYISETRSNLRVRESVAQMELINDLQEKQMEVFAKMQESNVAMMTEVVKTSAASADVMKTWLEGFKQVEIPSAHEWTKSEEQMLEELKEEYRMENPETAELAAMTAGLLDNFRFEQ